jgi:hypothetical protein
MKLSPGWPVSMARQSRIVELRFFGGLTEEQTAKVLGVSSKTVNHDWIVARAWLHGEIAGWQWTPERWERIKELFDAALAQTPPDRAAFVRSTCGEDSARCGEVERPANRLRRSGCRRHRRGSRIWGNVAAGIQLWFAPMQRQVY